MPQFLMLLLFILIAFPFEDGELIDCIINEINRLQINRCCARD